jgi:hypothetical protein
LPERIHGSGRKEWMSADHLNVVNSSVFPDPRLQYNRTGNSLL